MAHTITLSPKAVLALLFLQIAFSSASLAQIQTTYWPNSETIQETGNLVNGQKEGLWKTYHKNGAIKSEITYINNSKRTGSSKWYDENEFLSATKNEEIALLRLFYRNGKIHWQAWGDPEEERNGPWMEKYQNGENRSSGHYLNGYKDGVWNYFHTNGTLYCYGNINKWNKRTGEWKFYYNLEKKTLAAEGEYNVEGWPISETWKTYDIDGKPNGINCPPPSDEQCIDLANEIVKKTPATHPSKELTMASQQTLLQLAGVRLNKDNKKTTKEKVQRFWKAYRTILTGLSDPDFGVRHNIAKLSVEVSNFTFIKDALNIYELDMNFIDPSDKETLMDYLSFTETNLISRFLIGLQKNDDLNQKISDTREIYTLAKSKGAKHAKEL